MTVDDSELELVTHSYTAQWIWDAGGGFVELQATDDMNAWQENFRIVIAAGETGRDHDESGNVVRVHFDEDGDGTADVTHSYRYEGSGACRDGSNPQFAARIVHDPADIVPDGCRFAPISPAILDAYGASGDDLRYADDVTLRCW